MRESLKYKKKTEYIKTIIAAFILITLTEKTTSYPNGAEYVVGVDIDNAITLEANSNTEKNGFSSKVKIVLGSFEDVPGEFDLVVANILIDSIVAISEDIKDKAKPSGTILLSGIKDEQKERAITKFTELGYVLTEIYSEKEWIALVFNQKA